MSSKNIDFRLRTCKAIDRGLFLDLLDNLVSPKSSFSEYCYISMGASFLEDFREIYRKFPISRMISFDMYPNTVLRQNFNRTIPSIEIQKMKSSDFISNILPTIKEKKIFWLDFIRQDTFYEQFTDIYNTISVLRSGDIFKITLDSNVKAIDDKLSLRKDNFYRMMNSKYFEKKSYFSDDCFQNDIDFSSTLFNCIKSTIDTSIQSQPTLCWKTLSSFTYKDGAQMMTYAGIVLNKDEADNFITNSLKKWNFYRETWTKPEIIDAPALSLQEKFFIESNIHLSVEEIRKKLGYNLYSEEVQKEEDINNTNTNDYKDTISAIDFYIKVHKIFPWFSRIIA